MAWVVDLDWNRMNSQEYDRLYYMRSALVNFENGTFTLWFLTPERLMQYIRFASTHPNLPVHPGLNAFLILSEERFNRICVPRPELVEVGVVGVDFWVRNCFRRFLSCKNVPWGRERRELVFALAEMGACKRNGRLVDEYCVSMRDLKDFGGDQYCNKVMLHSLALTGIQCFPNLRIFFQKIKGLFRVWYEPEDYEIPPCFPKNHFEKERVAISLMKALNASAQHPISLDVLVNALLLVPLFDNNERYIRLVLRRLPLSRNPGRLGNVLNVVGANRLLVNRTSSGSFYLVGDLNLMMDELIILTNGVLNVNLDEYKFNVCLLLLNCCNDNLMVKKDLLEQRAMEQQIIQYDFVHSSMFWHVLRLLTGSLFPFRGFFVRTITDRSSGLEMLSIVWNNEVHEHEPEHG